MNKKEHCLICRADLEYLQHAATHACSYCGRTETAHTRCPRGHFLCDPCHGKDAMRMIEEIAVSSTSKDALNIAELMMAHPSLPMLGCEHAHIAAGALLAALRNSPYGTISSDAVREAFVRILKQARGGYCGLTGVCGIVPAVGAVFSIFLGPRCGSGREQRIVMEAASKTSMAITDLTGPSCCKAYVRAAVPVAVMLFQERFGIILPVGKPEICMHSAKHPHGCREEKCPFFRREASRDIFADSTDPSRSSFGPT